MILALAGLLAAVSPTQAAGLNQIVGYTSPVDGSRQEYGVYVPGGAAPAEGYAVVLHAHGYGWAVSADFSQWQKEWADRYGWILVQLNARGPQFYWGIGDLATSEVIDDLDLRFGIDRWRVYITGASMGGTGAYRQGLMHPTRIAASAGVDGWTDFREWHWHWYARKDMRDDIEEFRRPLLEVASPLYLPERARWNSHRIIADNLDDVVYPLQETRVTNQLLELQTADPAAYDHELVFHRDRGHGGGYDLESIYPYFLGRSTRPQRDAFTLSSTTLDYGELYWGRLERFRQQGLRAVLDVTAHLEGAVPEVGVVTQNVDAFSLLLPASPVADAPRVQVWVDGMPAYEGPAGVVTLEAERDAGGRLVGWHEAEPAVRGASWRKTPEMPGPLGHAFVRPLRVCWGTRGEAALTGRHEAEARAFVAGWNDFMVHGPGLVATPESEVTAGDLERCTLVVFGTLESSSLLAQAQSARGLPVEVHSQGVRVRDPLTGDRWYRGAGFGAFVACPNPLTDGHTYLVACSGRYASQPGGGELRGLEFDLEKLCWGYPDYVVFNSQLPHVMNVNNKPPVTCYEAGYFVEAGYFDARWQPDRFVTLDRVRSARPERSRLVHVAEVRVERSGLAAPVFGNVDGDPADPPRAALATAQWMARVRVVDETGAGVKQARVTGTWQTPEGEAVSKPTLSDGNAWFGWSGAGDPPSFRVLNVMATGAEYDFAADAAGGSAWREVAPGVLAVVDEPRVTLEGDLPQTVGVRVANQRGTAARVRLEACGTEALQCPGLEATVAAGATQELRIEWAAAEGSLTGPVAASVRVIAGGGVALLPVALRQLPGPGSVVLGEPVATDAEAGGRVRLTAEVRSLETQKDARVSLVASVVEAPVHLPARALVLMPGERQTVQWEWEADAQLPRGEYRVTVSSPGGRLAGTASFVVRQGTCR